MNVFVILTISTGLSRLAPVVGYARTAARQFQPELPIFAAALVAATAICAWLVPQIDLLGAAIGAAARSLTETFGAARAFSSAAAVRTEMRRMQRARR